MFVKAQWNWGPIKFSIGVDPLNMLPSLLVPGLGSFSLYIGKVIKISGKDLVVDCADLIVRRIFKECVKHFFSHREKKEGKNTWSSVFEVIKITVLVSTIVGGLQLFSQPHLYTPVATCASVAFAIAILAYHHLPSKAKAAE